jgi:hypothetical protein
MNKTDQPRPPPTITGAFFTLFEAILVLLTDLCTVVLGLVTPWNLFVACVIAVCLYLIKLFWDFLCDERNVRITKAYVNAVRTCREMCRLSWEMEWVTICGKIVLSAIMLVITLGYAFMFIFWAGYCFFGSLVCQLDTYTQERADELLAVPVKPAVAEPVPAVSGIQGAMGRIRGTPPVASADTAGVVPRMRGVASSGVMGWLKRVPVDAEANDGSDDKIDLEVVEKKAVDALVRKVAQAVKEQSGRGWRRVPRSTTEKPAGGRVEEEAVGKTTGKRANLDIGSDGKKAKTGAGKGEDVEMEADSESSSGSNGAEMDADGESSTSDAMAA